LITPEEVNHGRKGTAPSYSAPVPISVALAEDNALLRQGLERLIEHAEGLELVGTATDLPGLRALVLAETPDVVVTDIRMPPSHTDEGIQAARWLRETHPGVGVVLLSQHAEAAYALALLDGGAAGRAYLLKERVAGARELADAVVEGLVAANRRSPRSRLDPLTPRELEVLGEMAQGKSNAAIAATLVLSERAIEKHTNSIFMKLGLTEERDRNRRVTAVLVYLNEGGGG
jgi:DNA-binding NarL/FixJ family response regulator